MCEPELDDLDGPASGGVRVNRPDTWLETLWAMEAGFKTDTDRTVETPEIQPHIVPIPAEEPVAVPA